MCRIFGFRSIIPSRVHRSLIAAENALGQQSNDHPDGWGVAFYVDGAPHVMRSPLSALGDQLFHRLSGVASSETVLAHVRKATQGPKTVLNCHPFQYGRWVFAHNGDIPDFARHRPALLNEVSPLIRGFILGETDSEVVFFMFLSQMLAFGPLHRHHAVDDVVTAVQHTSAKVREICDTEVGQKAALLTFVVTDGHGLVAVQGGKEIYLSTYKKRCSDREDCPSLSAECEAASVTGFVNHLIVSSEPLQGENIWEALAPGDVVGCDWRMRVVRTRLHGGALASDSPAALRT